MACFYTLENNIFCTSKYTPTKNYNINMDNAIDIKEASNNPDFFTSSMVTERVMESAMKYLNLFRERLENAKTLLSDQSLTEVNDSNQFTDIVMYNNPNPTTQSQLVYDMLKLECDIRDMKKHILSLKTSQHPIPFSQQTPQNLEKADNLDTSLDIVKKGLRTARLLKESYDVFKKDLITRFPILLSELSTSQIDTPNSTLTKTYSNSNISSASLYTSASSTSTLNITDNFEINNESFLENTMLNTEILWKSIPNFYQPLDSGFFLRNDIEPLSSLDIMDGDIET